MLPPSDNIFLKLLDYFAANTNHSNNHESLYRHRLLTGIILIQFIVIGLMYVYITLVSQDNSKVVTLLNYLSIPLLSIYTFLLLFLRYTGKYQIISHLLIGVLCIGASVGTYYSGGPLVSHSGYVFMVPAVLAYCLTGWIGGSVWTIFIFLYYSFMIYSAKLSGFFPAVGLPTMPDVTWFVSFFSVMSLVMIYERMTQQLQCRLEEQKHAAEYLSLHDALTGLPNRAYFDEELPRAALRSDRSKKPFALIYMDLDGFKPINDQLGHDAGDLVLRSVAEHIKIALRGSDFACRLGGDEFSVVIENFASKEDIGLVAEKLLAAIKTPVTTVKGSPFVTGSVGIAVYPDDAQNIDELRRLADQSMYKAKESHNTYALHSAIA